MTPTNRVPAQAMVILGFVVTALASVISYIDTVSQRSYQFNGFRIDVIPLLEPLIVIAAALAWWWLVRIEASDEVQRSSLRVAYLAFAVQYLLTSALFLIVAWPIESMGGFWLTATYWLRLVGAFVTALGLVLLSETLRSPSENIESAAEPVEIS